MKTKMRVQEIVNVTFKDVNNKKVTTSFAPDNEGAWNGSFTQFLQYCEDYEYEPHHTARWVHKYQSKFVNRVERYWGKFGHGFAVWSNYPESRGAVNVTYFIKK